MNGSAARTVRACVSIALLATLALAFGACSKKSPEERAAAAQEYLNLGNKAFSAKNYDEALSFYEKATKAEPMNGAAYFGIYMVYTAQGDKAKADEAFAKAKALAPGLGGGHPGGMGGMGGMGDMMGGLAALDSTGGDTTAWMRHHADSMRALMGNPK